MWKNWTNGSSVSWKYYLGNNIYFMFVRCSMFVTSIKIAIYFRLLNFWRSNNKLRCLVGDRQILIVEVRQIANLWVLKYWSTFSCATIPLQSFHWNCYFFGLDHFNTQPDFGLIMFIVPPVQPFLSNLFLVPSGVFPVEGFESLLQVTIWGPFCKARYWYQNPTIKQEPKSHIKQGTDKS